jgi:hypothetical protein
MGAERPDYDLATGFDSIRLLVANNLLLLFYTYTFRLIPL